MARRQPLTSHSKMFPKPKKESPSIVTVQNTVTDLDLLKYYIGFEKSGLYKSPVRYDNNPSFGIYQVGDKVRYKDFATNESGGIYDLLMLKFNLNFDELLKKISEDFGVKSTSIIAPQVRTKVVRKACEISVRLREWKIWDQEYWESYGISIQTLNKFDVYPIDYYWINGSMFRGHKNAYAYLEVVNGTVYYKIYQPLADKKKKWFNNYPKDTISLLRHFKDMETCFICSSVKDALCLYENIGVPCICPQGEGYILPLSLLEDYPKCKFGIIYDNDEKGIEYSEVAAKRLGVENFQLPKFEGKDISDFYKAKGKEAFLSFFLQCKRKLEAP